MRDDYLGLRELEAEGYSLIDLPPPYLTGLDGDPIWELAALDHLLGPAAED